MDKQTEEEKKQADGEITQAGEKEKKKLSPWTVCFIVFIIIFDVLLFSILLIDNTPLFKIISRAIKDGALKELHEVAGGVYEQALSFCSFRDRYGYVTDIRLGSPYGRDSDLQMLSGIRYTVWIDPELDDFKKACEAVYETDNYLRKNLDKLYEDSRILKIARRAADYASGNDFYYDPDEDYYDDEEFHGDYSITYCDDEYYYRIKNDMFYVNSRSDSTQKRWEYKYSIDDERISGLKLIYSNDRGEDEKKDASDKGTDSSTPRSSSSSSGSKSVYDGDDRKKYDSAFDYADDYALDYYEEDGDWDDAWDDAEADWEGD